MKGTLEPLLRRTRYALAVALVVSLAACGGSSSPEGLSAEEFASTLCSSVELWRDRLADGSQVLAERLNTAATLREARTEFLRFFDGAIRETDVMMAEVTGIEPPAYDGGDAIVADVVEVLGRFKPLLVDARTKITNLPLSDEVEFITGAQTVGAPYLAEVEQLGPTIGAAVERSGIPEVSLAVEVDPACKRL